MNRSAFICASLLRHAGARSISIGSCINASTVFYTLRQYGIFHPKPRPWFLPDFRVSLADSATTGWHGREQLLARHPPWVPLGVILVLAGGHRLSGTSGCSFPAAAISVQEGLG